DWAVPQYREQVALGHFGEELLYRHFLYVRGHPEGAHYPESLRVFPIQISLAAQVPHAVGLAWGMRLQRQPGAVIAYFGDGASSATAPSGRSRRTGPAIPSCASVATSKAAACGTRDCTRRPRRRPTRWSTRSSSGSRRPRWSRTPSSTTSTPSPPHGCAASGR